MLPAEESFPKVRRLYYVRTERGQPVYKVLVLTLALVLGSMIVSFGLHFASAGPCTSGPCSPDFTSLNNDISAYVPSEFRDSMLRRSALAERAAPAQQCLAAALLGSIGFEANGLAVAGKITQSGLRSIQADLADLIKRVMDPNAPCLRNVRLRPTPTVTPTPTPTPHP